MIVNKLAWFIHLLKRSCWQQKNASYFISFNGRLTEANGRGCCCWVCKWGGEIHNLYTSETQKCYCRLHSTVPRQHIEFRLAFIFGVFAICCLPLSAIIDKCLTWVALFSGVWQLKIGIKLFIASGQFIYIQCSCYSCDYIWWRWCLVINFPPNKFILFWISNCSSTRVGFICVLIHRL
jgi:hypothetical protein